ncbi:hypothetical protein [Haloimpatiens massiliensis]|nr:hypothetical protein [Haloimpatiens massiliensis]
MAIISIPTLVLLILASIFSFMQKNVKQVNTDVNSNIDNTTVN